uniref:Histidine kinase/HSP90-like ATPase domain-containing protein n=1 Tax=viral metagenome TaxID=1070528 RepID=A0A6C0BA52_9ZZZZ
MIASSDTLTQLFEERGGSWDEQGLVESLDKKGFTPNKCCSELIANSNDAQATKIIWKIESTHIKLIDDGIGMDRISLQNMFKMFKSNNSERKTMGISGLGGKEGIYILSKKSNKEPTTVVIYTCTKNGEYLKAIAPWKKISDEKIYTGNITFTNMTEEEIIRFGNDLKDCKFQHGTVIVFDYNDALKQLIETQFSVDEICKLKMSPNDRWDMIFGHADSEIVLEKTDGTQPVSIGKYDYFCGNETEFYTGKNSDIIHHYIDDKNEDRYVLISEAGPQEIVHHGKMGFKTEPSVIRIHQTWKSVGIYEVLNGLRVDKRIFDHQNPTPFSTAATILNNYDSQYFTEIDAEYVKESLSGCSVYRTSQLITKISFDDKTFNAKTSRGNSDTMLNKFHHRTEVRYTTYSKQDNRMDIAMGIQENKNQNQNVLPKQLERLIIYSKRDHLKKINTYFENVMKAKEDQEKKKRLLIAQQKKIEEEQKQLQKNLAEEQKRLKSNKKTLVMQESESESESKSESCNNTVIQVEIEQEEEEEEEEEEEKEEEKQEEEEQEQEEEVQEQEEEVQEQDITKEKEKEQEEQDPINIEKIVALLQEKCINDNVKLETIYKFINNL